MDISRYNTIKLLLKSNPFSFGSQPVNSKAAAPHRSSISKTPVTSWMYRGCSQHHGKANPVRFTNVKRAAIGSLGNASDNP